MKLTYVEMIHISKKNVNLNDLCDGGSGFCEDSFEVGQTLFGFIGNRALHEMPVGSYRNLTGQKYGERSFDSLRLMERIISSVRQQATLIQKDNELAMIDAGPT